MTMFEMIDELEPIIPESEMMRYKADRQRNWCHENPEAFKRLWKKRNQHRRKKGERNERDVVDCR